jgi:predicted DNA-binding ribbon-helix-helix protein
MGDWVMKLSNKSLVVKRSVVINGLKTSVSLEDPFWNCMKEIAKERGLTLSQLVALIALDRREGNLSSIIRQFVFGVYRDRVEAVKHLVKLAQSSEIHTDVNQIEANRVA